MNFWIVCVSVLFYKVVCIKNALIVNAPAGQIEGIVTTVKHGGQGYKVTSFLGIPFAEPPIKELRFAKPVKKKHFDKSFKAIERGPGCIGFDNEPSTSTNEDCLNLNVIVPIASNNEMNCNKKAVMIYIHGGWWQFGRQDKYISPAFVAKNDVILVTLNYRLSVYGFLANEDFGFKGNYGLWDQHMAIQWVHDNIEAFGGDPSRITIFGNSAGGASVLFQAFYPGNKGLFKGVIAQSGSVLSPWAHNRNNNKTFTDFIKRCGCDFSADLARCLRNLSTSEIKVGGLALTGKLHLPVFDGEFVTFSTQEFALHSEARSETVDRLSSFDLIIGLTSCDGSWSYKVFTSMLKKKGADFAKGINELEFRYLTKKIERLLDLDFNSLETNAIMHEYIDWSDPNNSSSKRDAILNLQKDLEFTNGAVIVALAHARGKGRGQTYMYEFDLKPSFSKEPDYIRGPIHQDELSYVFGFPNGIMAEKRIPDEDPVLKLTKEEVEFSDKIQDLWTTFAKASTPEDFNSFPWPKFNTADGKYLKLRADGFSTGSHYRGSAIHFWNVLMPEIEATEDTHICDVSGALENMPLNSFTNILLSFLTVMYHYMLKHSI